MDDNLLKFGIAIIGMAGRFPGADSVDQFWKNLCHGDESISFFTENELAAAGVSEKMRKDPHYVPAKAILQDIAGFDASFFNISPHEAELIDPQQRLFLEIAWEVLEKAGYDTAKYPGRVGVFASSSKNTYLMFNLFSYPELREMAAAVQVLIANDKDYISTRVSYRLNLRGPSLTVQTACSSSLVAVHLACQSLLAGECDIALAGGAAIDVPHKAGYMFLPDGIFSPDGHCRAFDNDARGTIFGQGVGGILLKPLGRALEEGDWIHAVIRGSAINNDGGQKVGFTSPGVDGQASVIADALAVADVHPDTISYIEAHGTGTALGDPIEVEALTQVFREKTERRNFCALGSVKANIGHLNAASGVMGMIKTALITEHGILPPAVNFWKPNSRIDFANSPFYVSTDGVWKNTHPVRRCGVSSFGIGGTNAHVILEKAPGRETINDKQTWQLIPFSARSLTGLEEYTKRLAEALAEKKHLPLADIAYTLQAGRHSFPYRRLLLCRNVDQAVQILQDNDPAKLLNAVVIKKSRPCFFLFPGAENHDPALTARLYSSEPIFRQEFDACLAGITDIIDINYCRTALAKGSNPAELFEYCKKPGIAHLLFFITEYALARLWMMWGFQPAGLYGSGVGGYVAACLSGIFTTSDILMFVYKTAAGITEPALDTLEEFVDTIERRPPRVPVFSQYTGTWITEKEVKDPACWSVYMDHRIQAGDKFNNLLSNPDTILLEAGPGQTLTRQVVLCDAENSSRLIIPSLPADKSNASEEYTLRLALGRLWLAGLQPDWGNIHGSHNFGKVPLPVCPFEHQHYWIEPRTETQTIRSAEEELPATIRKQWHERPQLDYPYQAPQTQWEQGFAAIFEELLSIKPIGMLDNFYDLGGDSLLGAQLVIRAREHFQIDLQLNDLFTTPTVKEMAALAESIQKSGHKEISKAHSPGSELDLELDPGIIPPQPYVWKGLPAAVLLTGATGFLGAYILNELLIRTKAEIFCLVRAASTREGMERLQNNLKQNALASGIPWERVHIVTGDTSRPFLGISNGEYEQLANQIDAVYHSAARLSFVEPYSGIREINVLGTVNAIRFACHRLTKRFHYVSSIAAFDSDSFRNLEMATEEQSLGNSTGFHSGYDETKWVAEMITGEAGKRGLPVTIYRPGNITGDSRNGTFSINDLIGRMFRGCLQLGYVPDDEAYVDLEPVDYVGKALVHLSLQQRSVGNTYHLVNPHYIRWSEIVKIIQGLGYEITAEPFSAWRERLRTEIKAGRKNPLLSLFPMFDQRPLFSGRRYDCRNTLQELRNTDISCPAIDQTLIQLYTRYLEKMNLNAAAKSPAL